MWMTLASIMLAERSHLQKATNCMVLLIDILEMEIGSIVAWGSREGTD